MSPLRKNPLKIVFALFFVTIIGSTVSANVLNVDKVGCELLPMKCGLYGSWEYSAENAPDSFRVGALSIFFENGQNNVFVQLDENQIFGEKVSLEGNTISFVVKLKGTLFIVKLTAKGEVLTGTYSTEDDTFQIKGARVKVA